MFEPLLSVALLAHRLGISELTLRRRLAQGKIACHKIGGRVLFTEEDVKSFLKSCEVPARCPLTAREQMTISSKAAAYEN